VAGLAVLGTGQALASHVSCGDTITTDTKLKRDLVNCPNNGIVIGADNITLDLNGHTIDGDGEPTEDCALDEICDVGVVNDGHPRVTVKGGSIREFGDGVLLLAASHNRLRHLSVSSNVLRGILLVESSQTRIEGSAITRNGLTTDQAGLVLFTSHNNRIERNRLSGNGDIGLFSVDPTNDNRIANNTFSDNPEAAILIEGNGNQRAMTTPSPKTTSPTRWGARTAAASASRSRVAPRTSWPEAWSLGPRSASVLMRLRARPPITCSAPASCAPPPSTGSRSASNKAPSPTRFWTATSRSAPATTASTWRAHQLR